MYYYSVTHTQTLERIERNRMKSISELLLLGINNSDKGKDRGSKKWTAKLTNWTFFMYSGDSVYNL